MQRGKAVREWPSLGAGRVSILAREDSPVCCLQDTLPGLLDCEWLEQSWYRTPDSAFKRSNDDATAGSCCFAR